MRWNTPSGSFQSIPDWLSFHREKSQPPGELTSRKPHKVQQQQIQSPVCGTEQHQQYRPAMN